MHIRDYRFKTLGSSEYFIAVCNQGLDYTIEKCTKY